MPVGSDDSASNSTRRNGNAACRPRPTLVTQASPVELIGQVGELAAELGVGWTAEGSPPPGVAHEAARHPSPQQESAETVRVSAETARCVTVVLQQRSIGRWMLTYRRGRLVAREVSCSARWRRSCSQNSAVAVSGGDGEMLGLHSRLAGGCRDAAPAPAPASLRSPPRRVSPKVGATEESASEESGADLGMRDDARVRQVARKHPGSLAASAIVSFARQIGYAQATGELEASANVRHLAVSYLNRALLAQAGPRFGARRSRQLRTLARSRGRTDARSDNDRDGHPAALPAPCEASILDERRMERCATSRSASRNQGELGDSRPTDHVGGGAPKPPSQTEACGDGYCKCSGAGMPAAT